MARVCQSSLEFAMAARERGWKGGGRVRRRSLPVARWWVAGQQEVVVDGVLAPDLEGSRLDCWSLARSEEASEEEV